MRGKQFERLVKWWLTQDPIWSRKVKNVWLWDEWPDYPGRDIGIDLVAEMTDGTLCAVQAKCFDENRDIPKSELDSFISAASQRTFQHRLLVATTDGLSANAKRMLADQLVVPVMRSYLESSLDVWPASIEELSAPAQPHASPRPHQNLAITDVTNGFEGNSRGQLIMACGTGKTLTALWIKETLKPKTTLVLVPSLNLLAQTLSEWAKNSLSPWQYLCVCSDDTVNKLDDQPISTVADLPFEVTTNPADIAMFLSLGGERIIFSTYQSSAQVAKAQKQSGVSFDLVICDEAHRLTGKTDTDYSTVLDEKKIVGQKRLFMTATPRTYTTAAKTKAEDRGVEITSMDDEHVYGPVLHKLSFGEAIKQDLLSDYRVLIVGVTDPQVQDLIDRRELVSVNDAVNTDARTLAAHIGLAKATKDYDLKRTISFHSRIKSADKFARDHLKILDWLPDTHKPSGDTWTGTISGAMNTGDRRRLIKQLSLDGEDRHALLTNARCLTEGVDVPSLDGIAFIDPRSSQVDIIQAVGRAIRKSKNKVIGTIVLPVLIPTDSDAEHAIEDSSFKPIWAILNALKSHDDDFAIELNNLRTELGRTGKPGDLPNRLVEDLPANIDSLLPGFSQKLSVAIIEQSTSPWEFWLGLMANYVKDNGNAYVPVDFRVGKFRLGQWVNSQRTKFKNGELEQERINKLETLEAWTWSQLDEVWNSYYQLLTEFVGEFGHSLVPHKPELYEGQKLFAWINMQRSRFSKGKLEIERSSRLESLPGWTWTPKEDNWDQWLLLLDTYASTNGHTQVPQGYLVDTQDLGRWVSAQRTRYNKGKLEQDRISRLESFPAWTWNPHEANWETSFAALTEYTSKNGEARPPQSLVFDNIQLGSWVSHQRSEHRKGRLEQEKVVRLELLPGWIWDSLSDSWDNFFSALIRYTNENRSARPPKSYEADGIQLGAWVSAQRTRYNKGKLEQDRISRLESLAGWTWDQASEAWDGFFAVLDDYVNEFGAATPPQSYVIGRIKLGTWVNGQRQKYKKGQLGQQETRRLEALPGWTWEPLNGLWEAPFAQLVDFANEHGHVNVPDNRLLATDSDLSGWIKRQRTAFKSGSLEQQKISQLEALPGWSWSPRSESWESFFELLKVFASEHGHALVPQKSLYKTEDLASWVNSQRTRFKKGLLETNRIEKLESVVGWSWDPLAESWETYFALLKEYSLEYGHARVPQGTAATLYKGENLARWVNQQRSRYNKGNLETERVEKLETIVGWVWSPLNETWNSYFNLLKEFIIEHGHTKVPREPKLYKGVGLSTWVQSQRSNYKKEKMDQQSIIRLESLPGWAWNPHDTLWEESYAALHKYTLTHNSASPPRSYISDDIKIGSWVVTQRQKYKKQTLTKDQIERLEALDGWTWQQKSSPKA
jgi:superfamily II DNA or RNA helicase